MSVDTPFSYPIEIAVLPPKGRDFEVTAKADDCAAIAMALGLEKLEALTARLTVLPGEKGSVSVSGRVDADVVQACVVTLQPLPSHVREEITRTFHTPRPAPSENNEKRKHAPVEETEEEEEGWVDPNDEVIDPVINGRIDLGVIITEQLMLALDPYPRAPGATFGGASAGEDAPEPGPASPFAALAALKTAEATPRRLRGKTATPRKGPQGKGKTGR